MKCCEKDRQFTFPFFSQFEFDAAIVFLPFCKAKSGQCFFDKQWAESGQAPNEQIVQNSDFGRYIF